MAQAAAKTRAALKIDVLVESDLWKQAADAEAIVRRAVAEAAAMLSTPRAELAILLTDDSAIRLLNRSWRGIDAATNVLSFPAGRAGGEPPLIGDIVLAYETIAREARRRQAVHSPCRPSCRARFPASSRLRSCAQQGRRKNGRPRTRCPAATCHSRPLSAGGQGLNTLCIFRGRRPDTGSHDASSQAQRTERSRACRSSHGRATDRRAE
jgi:hypothetical protein